MLHAPKRKLLKGLDLVDLRWNGSGALQVCRLAIGLLRHVRAVAQVVAVFRNLVVGVLWDLLVRGRVAQKIFGPQREQALVRVTGEQWVKPPVGRRSVGSLGQGGV